MDEPNEHLSVKILAGEFFQGNFKKGGGGEKAQRRVLSVWWAGGIFLSNFRDLAPRHRMER